MDEKQAADLVMELIDAGFDARDCSDKTTKFTIDLSWEQADKLLKSFGPSTRFATSVEEANRPLTQGKVSLYARQMAEGKWTRCVDPIVVSDRFILIAGQHRLTAQVKSRTTQRWDFIVDAPQEYRRGLMGGKPWRKGEVIGGVGMMQEAALAVAAYLVFKRGSDGVSIDELSEAKDRWWDDCQLVCRKLVGNIFKRASMHGAFIVALGSAHRDEVLGLIDELVGFAPTTPGASAILKLVNSHNARLGITDRLDQALQILRGAQAHVCGEEITLLRPTTQGLLFFEPKAVYRLNRPAVVQGRRRGG